MAFSILHRLIRLRPSQSEAATVRPPGGTTIISFSLLTLILGITKEHLQKLASMPRDSYHSAVYVAVTYFFALITYPPRYKTWAQSERSRLRSREKERVKRRRQLDAEAELRTPADLDAKRLLRASSPDPSERRRRAETIQAQLAAELPAKHAACDAREREWSALLDAQQADMTFRREYLDTNFVPGKDELAATVRRHVEAWIGGLFARAFDELARDLEHEIGINGQTEGLAQECQLGARLKAVAEREKTFSEGIRKCKSKELGCG